MSNPLSPSATVLIKLGSALVHAEEAFVQIDKNDRHALAFDRAAFDTVAQDSEVVAWLSEMDAMAFLPEKRS